MKRNILGISILVVCIVCVSLFTACESGTSHTHNYATDWTSDNNYHWHACLNDGCDQKQNAKAPHMDNDGNCVCDVCGATGLDKNGLNLVEMCNSRYGYDYLGTMSNGAARQSLYMAIDKEVVALHNNVETNCKADVPFAQVDYSALNLTSDDAVAVWKTYFDDNPLYYWCSNLVSYSNTVINLLVAEDYCDGAVRQECNQLVYNKIQEYLVYVQSESNAYQIALAFHDKIINAIDYAYDSNGAPESARWAHSIIGVFDERGGACESYAKTFQLLLNVRGVENIIVNGQGNGAAHAWNLIRLDDGQWYWCDLTWDDSPNYAWGIYYGYFCVNDKQGVDWADGSNQYGTETGTGIGGSPSGSAKFLKSHTQYSSSGKNVRFLYDLPERSKHIYEGVSDELTLRDTFKVGDIQYAIAGYRTVQVTQVQSSGDVVIAERVTHEGKSFAVISLGVIGGTKLFGAGSVFGNSVNSVTIPSTVVYVWGLTFYDCNFNDITFTGTTEQWNSIEKSNYWKNLSKTLTIHCLDGDITA